MPAARRTRRARTRVRSVVTTLACLQLFEADRNLPGQPGGPPTRQLAVCLHGDWWDFVYQIQEDFCQTHGWWASRTPPAGTDVHGPCLKCGQPMVLRSYTPGAHDRANLIHPECRSRGGTAGA
jgi:hypothetical protein